MSDVLSHYAVVKIRDWGTYYYFSTRKPQCCGMARLLAQGDQRYPVA